MDKGVKNLRKRILARVARNQFEHVALYKVSALRNAIQKAYGGAHPTL